jgi:hypothetical protein
MVKSDLSVLEKCDLQTAFVLMAGGVDCKSHVKVKVNLTLRVATAPLLALFKNFQVGCQF